MEQNARGYGGLGKRPSFKYQLVVVGSSQGKRKSLYYVLCVVEYVVGNLEGTFGYLRWQIVAVVGSNANRLFKLVFGKLFLISFLSSG